MTQQNMTSQQGSALDGLAQVMKTYEDMKKMFAILKKSIFDAEEQFDRRYQEIVAGINSMQRSEAGTLANIAKAIGEFAAQVEGFKGK